MDFIKEYEEKINRLLTSKWAVGFHDRGMGHGDFGVIIATEEELSNEELENLTDDEFIEYHRRHIPEIVIPNIPKELAEHLVDLHNNAKVELQIGPYKAQRDNNGHWSILDYAEKNAKTTKKVREKP